MRLDSGADCALLKLCVKKGLTICPELARFCIGFEYMADQRELTTALREARLAAASKLDATLDLADARALRLDALRAELLPIVEGHADAQALFNLNVQPGATPKLWLDLISSVVMEPDPRTYRLVQDQDSRREKLFESSDLKEMSAYVVKYLAHRMIAHEKMARRLVPLPERPIRSYSLFDLVYVWVTGAIVGILGLLTVAILMGKVSF